MDTKMCYTCLVNTVIINQKFPWFIFVCMFLSHGPILYNLMYIIFKLGLERFHSVAILGFNSPEWFISAVGAIFAG